MDADLDIVIFLLAFQNSYMFMLLHCTKNALFVISTNPDVPLSTGIAFIFTLSFGGNIVSNILTGSTPRLFLHPYAIPLYLFGYLLYRNIPTLSKFLLNSRTVTTYIELFDAIARSFTLINFLNRFASINIGSEI